MYIIHCLELLIKLILSNFKYSEMTFFSLQIPDLYFRKCGVVTCVFYVTFKLSFLFNSQILGNTLNTKCEYNSCCYSENRMLTRVNLSALAPDAFTVRAGLALWSRDLPRLI